MCLCVFSRHVRRRRAALELDGDKSPSCLIVLPLPFVSATLLAPCHALRPAWLLQTDASGNTVLMLLAARPSLLDTARCLLTWRVEQLEATAPQQQQQQQQQQQVVKQGLDVLRLNAEGRDALGVALAAKNRRCAEELLTHLVTVGPPAGPLAAAPAAAPAQHAGAATAPAAPTAAASPAAVVTRAYEALVRKGCAAPCSPTVIGPPHPHPPRKPSPPSHA